MSQIFKNASGGGGGGGDVTGPASAVSDNIVVFNGNTGKIIKDSGIPISSINSSYALNMITSAQPVINDSTTYFMAMSVAVGVWSGNSTSGQVKMWIPKNGTLTSVYGSINFATPASNENVTINVRVNNITDYTITSNSQWTSSPTTFSNNAMNIPLVAGDYISFTIVTPVWVTNPATATFNATAFIN